MKTDWSQTSAPPAWLSCGFTQQQWDVIRIEQLQQKERGRPIDRLRRILVRLSRDRWLSYSELLRISWEFAEKATLWRNNVLRAIDKDLDACRSTGMLRGKPAANPADPGYEELVKRLRYLKSPPHRGAAAEQLILLHQLNRLKARNPYGR